MPGRSGGQPPQLGWGLPGGSDPLGRDLEAGEDSTDGEEELGGSHRGDSPRESQGLDGASEEGGLSPMGRQHGADEGRVAHSKTEAGGRGHRGR